MTQNQKITLMDFISNKATGLPWNDPEMAAQVFKGLCEALKKEDKISIDISSITTGLTPSFAYNVFGKLFDEFGEAVSERIVFDPDPYDLRSRVIAAIKRRKIIIESERANHLKI